MYKIFKVKDKEYYYNLDDIKKANANYNIIFGKKGNGKTYAIITEIVNQFFKTGKPSAYVRRYDADIKSASISSLITDNHVKLIKKLSHGKYDRVIYKAKKFYVGKYNNITKKVEFDNDNILLYCFALNNWEHENGGDIGELAILHFDEFLTRQNYLKDEFIKFTNLVSKLKRDRNITIYMTGNTFNEYAPYWDEMGLTQIRHQKQGEIAIYTYNTDKLKVAVEYCLDSDNTKQTDFYFGFNNPRLDMIKKGTWEQSQYRHLTKRYTKDDIKQVFYVIFDRHYIRGVIYKQNKDLLIYYTPCKELPNDLDNTIIYTDQPVTNRLHTNSFDITACHVHKIIRVLMATNRDYYTNNYIGEIINNFKKYSRERAI